LLAGRIGAMLAAVERDDEDDAAMAYTDELQRAERRLSELINAKADSVEADARADRAERIRRDDLRCRDLAAEFQGDYAAHGVSPPLPNANEWAADYERRLLKGLQRRLSPRNSYADDSMLDEIPASAMPHFAKMIRDEAAKEAYSPCEENLPESPSDPRALIDRTDDMGQRRIEFRARRSFIHDLSMQPLRVLRMIGKNGDVIFGPGFDKAPRR
jgi:hypothetical protein